MNPTIGQQLAAAYAPFLSAPPKKGEDIREVLKALASDIDNSFNKSEAAKIVEELANIGIHSPVKDPVINKFNAVVHRAKTYIAHR